MAALAFPGAGDFGRDGDGAAELARGDGGVVSGAEWNVDRQRTVRQRSRGRRAGTVLDRVSSLAQPARRNGGVAKATLRNLGVFLVLDPDRSSSPWDSWLSSKSPTDTRYRVPFC
jgi:hypothetical protein